MQRANRRGRVSCGPLPATLKVGGVGVKLRKKLRLACIVLSIVQSDEVMVQGPHLRCRINFGTSLRLLCNRD